MSWVKILSKMDEVFTFCFHFFWLLGLSAANNQSNNHQIKCQSFDDYLWIELWSNNFWFELQSNNFNNQEQSSNNHKLPNRDICPYSGVQIITNNYQIIIKWLQISQIIYSMIIWKSRI